MRDLILGNNESNESTRFISEVDEQVIKLKLHTQRKDIPMAAIDGNWRSVQETLARCKIEQPVCGIQEATVENPESEASCAPRVPRSLLEAAESYGGLGWRIIPVDANKRPTVRWSKYQYQPARAEELSDWFTHWKAVKGLAVINGDASGGLVCRDFDDLQAYQRWAETHLELAKTLPTVETARGRHVYFISQSVKRTWKFTDGELRGSGINILPPSRHPSGVAYRWIIEPTASNLIPLDDLDAAGLGARATEMTEITENTEHTELTDDNRSHGRSNADDLEQVEPNMEKLIRATLPAAAGERNRQVFKLARSLKALAGDIDVEPTTFRNVVKRWHELALPVIRTKAFEETWIDFLQGWSKVKFGAGMDPVKIAMESACKAEPPGAVREYQPGVQLLAALCRELQKLHGTQPFFLSCRKAGTELEVDHATANRWLYLLVSEGLLVETAKGSQSSRRATRYRYVGD